MSSSNEEDPRIIRISSDDYETAQSHQPSPGTTESSENFPLIVSRFGHFVFHDDGDEETIPLPADLNRRIMRVTPVGISAHDSEDQPSNESSNEIGYEGDREVAYDSEWSFPDTPSPSPADEVAGSPRGDLLLDSLSGESSRGSPEQSLAEVEDEGNMAEVEDEETTSSGSIGAPSTHQSEDQESFVDQETSEDHDMGDQKDSDSEDNMSVEAFKHMLTDQIRQMMFVSGETAEPSIETTTLIEEITRQQVIEIVSDP